MPCHHPKCPQCHVEQKNGIVIGTFRCSNCGESLSISHNWVERRSGLSMVLAAIILLSTRINFGFAVLLWVPCSLVVGIVVCVVSALVRPPDLERHVPSGSLGLRD